MYDKYTKASSVTAHDSNDLSAVADALYIGAGDYTDAQAFATLAGDAGAAEYFYRGEDSLVFGGRGSSVTYLVNRGSLVTSGIPDDSDAEFKQTGGAAIPSIDSDDPTLNYKEFVTFSGAQFLKIVDDAVLDFGTGDFSIVFVVSFTDTGNNNKEAIVARDDDDSVWSVYKDTDNVIKVAHAGADPTSGVTVTDNRWYTVEWTRDSGTETIYIDGVNQGSTASNTENLSVPGAVKMFIGASSDSGNKDDYFKGKLAFFALWSATALSASDRTDVNNYINDRYLKTPQVDVAYISADNTSSVTSKRLERGTVHPLSVKRVMNTGTDGSSIIALYK